MWPWAAWAPPPRARSGLTGAVAGGGLEVRRGQVPATGTTILHDRESEWPKGLFLGAHPSAGVPLCLPCEEAALVLRLWPGLQCSSHTGTLPHPPGSSLVEAGCTA